MIYLCLFPWGSADDMDTQVGVPLSLVDWHCCYVAAKLPPHISCHECTCQSYLCFHGSCPAIAHLSRVEQPC